MNLVRILETLEKGGVLVHDEVDELRQEIRVLQKDAERYQWLTQHTAHLFLCTPEGLDEQVDKAMGRGKSKTTKETPDNVAINEEMKRVVGLILLLVKPDLKDKTIAGVFKRAFEVYQKAKEAE